VTKVWLFLF